MDLQPLTLEISLDRWREKRLFDVLPVPVAILNRDLEIVYGNKAFVQTFGPWESCKCWEVYHKSTEMCRHKSCERAFAKQAPIVSRGNGITITGQSIHYTKYSMPLLDAGGHVSHILEICIDNTSADILRNEYQGLLDLVPCCITIIDKELRIVETNRMVRDIYGDLEEKHCYQALKGQDMVCSDCLARKAFLRKKPQHDRQVWLAPDGSLRYYQITAVPIEDEKGEVGTIMEMGVDITENISLREREEMKTLMLTEIMHHSFRGLIVISDEEEIAMLNPALIRMLGMPAIGISRPQELYGILPANVTQAIHSGVDAFTFHDLLLFPERGEEAMPVNLHGTRLKKGNASLGLLLSFHDLREMRKLTKEKIEAERMAAVGQTVSGLSHGVKNLVTALEGGMYMLHSGMQDGRAERIAQGMDMLDRNIRRMGGFIKSFLHFARTREIKTRCCDPSAVALEAAEQFRIKAGQHGIELKLDVRTGVPEAPLDYEGLHESLTNLITNAIDACLAVEEDRPLEIIVSFHEEDGVLVYRVADTGCGMDDDTQKKVFANFFTTKGMNGTGLGLLMTKKLIQGHGGSIELESVPDQGTTFSIRLPRGSLPEPEDK